jgi:hypothetical protein
MFPVQRAFLFFFQNVSFGRRTFDINDANGVAHYIVKGIDCILLKKNQE